MSEMITAIALWCSNYSGQNTREQCEKRVLLCIADNGSLKDCLVKEAKDK